LLLDPEQGPKIGALINEELFVAGLGPTFAEDFDGAGDSRRNLALAEPRRGPADRAPADPLHERPRTPRTTLGVGDAVNRCAAVVRLGMLDPVSGAHMAQRIRERLPNAPLLALEDVAHWPQREAPKQVVAALLGA
jgi:pimeloyl-ACP methyl ester carboxylesterase